MSVEAPRLKLNPSPEQARLLDVYSRLVHRRAREYCLCLLSMRGEEVDYQDHDKGKTVILSPRDFLAYRQNHLKNWSPEGDADLSELFSIIASVSTQQIRGFWNPMFSETAKCGSKGATYDLLRKLREAGVLPFRLPDPIGGSGAEYSAWRMSHELVSSWSQCNAATVENYRRSEERLASLSLTPAQSALLAEFEETQGDVISRTLAERCRRYGFDVRGMESAMSWAQSRDADVDTWSKIFDYRVAAKNHDQLRPRARFTPPDHDRSRRLIAFGENYAGFKIDDIDPRSPAVFTLSLRVLDGEQRQTVAVPAMNSRYFRDLSLESGSGASHYNFRYQRGNFSPLPKDVVAVLKEVCLLRGDRDFYVQLPLNIGYPAADYHRLDRSGRRDVPAGTRFLSADLGLRGFWNFQVFEVGEAGEAKSVGVKGIVGQIKDRRFHSRCRELRDQVVSLKRLIRYLKTIQTGKPAADPVQRGARNALKLYGFLPDEVENLDDATLLATLARNCRRPCGPDPVSIWTTFLSEKIYDHRQSVLSLKDPRDYKSRQLGLAVESFGWICLLTETHRLLRMWRSRGKKPPGKFEPRQGFGRWHTYINNLKKDLIKKIGKAVIEAARREGCSCVVIENLEFERSAANTRKDNDLFSLWSPRSILDTVEYFARQYGVSVYKVEPSYTSQYNPDSKTITARVATSCYTMDPDNSIRRLHADTEVAATNIAHRFLDPVESTFAFEVRQISDHPDNPPDLVGCWLPSPNEFKSKFLARAYGTTRIVFRKVGDAHLAVPVAKDVYDKLRCGGKPQRLYRHGTSWVDAAGRQEIRHAILRAAGLSNVEVAKIRRKSLPHRPLKFPYRDGPSRVTQLVDDSDFSVRCRAG